MSKDGKEDEGKKNLPLESLDKIVGGSADMQSRFILDEPSRSPDAFDSGSSEVKLEPVDGREPRAPIIYQDETGHVPAITVTIDLPDGLHFLNDEDPRLSEIAAAGRDQSQVGQAELDQAQPDQALLDQMKRQKP